MEQMVGGPLVEFEIYFKISAIKEKERKRKKRHKVEAHNAIKNYKGSM